MFLLFFKKDFEDQESIDDWPEAEKLEEVERLLSNNPAVVLRLLPLVCELNSFLISHKDIGAILCSKERTAVVEGYCGGFAFRDVLLKKY